MNKKHLFQVFHADPSDKLRYDLDGETCKAKNSRDSKVSMIIAFLTDIFLLIIMLIGLFRLDCHRPGALATGRFLWNQVR